MKDHAQQGRLRSLELRLPPLPHTLPKVLEVLEGSGGASAMAEVVQHDPAVVARLLRQINSAFYGLRRSVSSVERAIRMMGPTTAAGTVIGISMLKLQEMANEEQVRSCFTSIIQHSMGTAFLSRFLLKQLPEGGSSPSGSAAAGSNPFASDGFTEGLLHDFGKMVLVYNYPEEAIALYEDRSIQEQIADTDECALEQLVFGCDHTEAGAYAASQLHFPAALVDTIRHHHAPASFTGGVAEQRCLHAVRAANCTTRAMGGLFAGPRASQTTADWEACACDPVWAHWCGAPGGEERQVEDLMQSLQAKEDDLAVRIDHLLSAEAAGAPAPFA